MCLLFFRNGGFPPRPWVNNAVHGTITLEPLTVAIQKHRTYFKTMLKLPSIKKLEFLMVNEDMFKVEWSTSDFLKTLTHLSFIIQRNNKESTTFSNVGAGA